MRTALGLPAGYFDFSSSTKLFIAAALVEYVKARWTPFSASWCAHAAPILAMLSITHRIVGFGRGSSPSRCSGDQG